MEKLGLHESKTDREEDSGRPFADLHISNYDDVFLSLVELEPGAPAENPHVILFTKNLDKAHQRLAVRGVAVEPTSTDSGGNRLFRLHDLEAVGFRFRTKLGCRRFSGQGRTSVILHIRVFDWYLAFHASPSEYSSFNRVRMKP